jgi:hypothetical protein
VWIGGNGPLDVEGFRSTGSPVMNAYQYFWRNGRIIGRVRAGTLGFDTRHGHNHWHFEQFARYALLGADRELAVRSHKQGFCLGPDDPVDLLAPRAVWQPPLTGLTSQWCGVRTGLWVREMLPAGWGDTYFNSVAGQSFDITNVPNGTYLHRGDRQPAPRPARDYDRERHFDAEGDPQRDQGPPAGQRPRLARHRPRTTLILWAAEFAGFAGGRLPVAGPAYRGLAA